MRILVISHMFPKTADSYSGIFVEQQVEELVKLGHQVTVVSPTAWAPFPLPYLSAKWKNYASIPLRVEKEGYTVFFPRTPMYPRNFLAHQSGQRVWRSLRRQLRLFRGDFDLIHAHVALPDGYAARKLAEEWKLPYVVTVHGSDFSTAINLNEKCYEAVNQALIKAAKVILVSSKLDKIRRERFAQLGEKFVIIPNGVSEAFLRRSQQDQIGVPPGESPAGARILKVLSVSNLIALKGIDDNLRALAEVHKVWPDFTYDIIGDGREKSGLEMLASELGLQEKVNFLGTKSAGEVKEYMDRCDVFSLPSWNEAFGVVYLEAMACGKPVIGCQGQGIADVLSQGETGFLVKARDVQSLAQTMQRLFEDASLRQTVGEQARQLVQNNFTWQKNAERTELVYSDVMADYRKSSGRADS